MRAATVLRLGVKELKSLAADPVLLFLILFTFTWAVYATARDTSTEVLNAAVGIVDEDHSQLSRRIAAALLPPFFKPPVEIDAAEIDRRMDLGDLVFVIELPPRLERDLLAGRRPTIQVDVDATAMTQAGNGAGYIQSIIAREAASLAARRDDAAPAPIDLVVRARFNPNLQSGWFQGVMQVINNITMLTVILTGAALIREREHGTIEHLLVMPVTPAEIMLAKIWANGLVIVGAALGSLFLVVEGLLGVPLAGSMLLFTGGMAVYLGSVAALGLLLATVTGSMGQFSLLVLPVLITLNLLSGTATPRESMPDWLQIIMLGTPTTQFVSFAQAVLYRGAGLDIVWPELAAMAAQTALFFAVTLARFRAAMARFG